MKEIIVIYSILQSTNKIRVVILSHLIQSKRSISGRKNKNFMIVISHTLKCSKQKLQFKVQEADAIQKGGKKIDRQKTVRLNMMQWKGGCLEGFWELSFAKHIALNLQIKSSQSLQCELIVITKRKWKKRILSENYNTRIKIRWSCCIIILRTIMISIRLAFSLW